MAARNIQTGKKCMVSSSTVSFFSLRYGLSFTVMSTFPADSLEGVADAGLLELVHCFAIHEVLKLFLILVYKLLCGSTA